MAKNVKIILMLDSAPKTLFFIKNPFANMSALELYLKKRGFNVASEGDIKKALVEIMKIQPDYIFVAWDHPNDRIFNLPKLIAQSMPSVVVAYCTSNEKSHIRKLQSSGQHYKLFPPQSGPAIQRLISRLEKENAVMSQSESFKADSGPAAQKSNTTQVRTIQSHQDYDQFMNSLGDPSTKPVDIYLDKGKRAQELRNKQLKNSYSNLFYIAPVQDVVSSNDFKMAEPFKKKLELTFDEKVKTPIEEMIETMSEIGQTEDTALLKNNTLEQTTHAFCLIIEHKNWTGYVVVASEDALDESALESALTQWLSEQLNENVDDLSEVFSFAFQMQLENIDFGKFSSAYADYTKIMAVNNKKTQLSFFSLSPEFIQIQLHELHDMIEVLTSEVPVSLPVPFDLNLYLPENKKFILYCKKDSTVANLQLDRLKEKRVDKLYSSLESEQMIQKFRAEVRIRKLIEKFKDGLKK